MRGQRFCLAPGCGAAMPPGQVMCPDHWRLCPAPLRRQLHKQWHRWHAAVDNDRDPLSAETAYNQAVTAARTLLGGTTP